MSMHHADIIIHIARPTAAAVLLLSARYSRIFNFDYNLASSVSEITDIIFWCIYAWFILPHTHSHVGTHWILRWEIIAFVNSVRHVFIHECIVPIVNCVLYEQTWIAMQYRCIFIWNTYIDVHLRVLGVLWLVHLHL